MTGIGDRTGSPHAVYSNSSVAASRGMGTEFKIYSSHGYRRKHNK